MDDRIKLDTFAKNLNQSISWQLTVWAIRWAIGFSLVALIVYLWPVLSWLWWVGGAIAVLSLAATLTIRFVLQRKIVIVQRKIAVMEKLAAEIDSEQ